MGHEDSATAVPLARRPWVWALALLLVAAATIGGLARASKDQPPPQTPTVHVGNLAKLPDEEFMRFLPTRADFPKGLQGFLTLTAADLRAHPEEPLPTDPPQCDPTAPLRRPGLLGEVRTESVASSAGAATSYTVGVARENRGQDLVAELDAWLGQCPEAALPSVSNRRETRVRKMIMERLPAPNVGADRTISYMITVTDKSSVKENDVLYPPQTHVMTLAALRGVALYVLARNTAPELDADQLRSLTADLVRRIRVY